MTRRRGSLYARAQAQRDAEKKRLAQAQTQAARAADRAQKAYLAAQIADQKERARLYTESRVAQVALQNEQLESVIAQLERLLTESLANDKTCTGDGKGSRTLSNGYERSCSQRSCSTATINRSKSYV